MSELTASQGAARSLRCTCGHPEHQHQWRGGGFTSTGKCWHKDRDFLREPDPRDPMIPFIYCACKNYTPDRADEGGGLEAIIADRIHPMMRDGDPHTRTDAVTEARAIIRIVADHFYGGD